MAHLDHFFVFSAAGAPERELLTARGLAPGAERRHDGQGTANVCFGFADCYLELIWLADEDEARTPLVKPLGLQERMRWRAQHASPFGVCVRPDQPGAPPPFAHWDYAPRYMPEGKALAMGCNSGVVGEPLLFQLDRPYAPFDADHALATATLRRLVVTTPALAPMSSLHDLDVARLELRDGDEHLMEVELATADGERGEVLDLRPRLPLVLRW